MTRQSDQPVNYDHPGLQTPAPRGEHWVPLPVATYDEGKPPARKFQQVIYGLRRMGQPHVTLNKGYNGITSFIDRTHKWLKEMDRALYEQSDL